MAGASALARLNMSDRLWRQCYAIHRADIFLAPQPLFTAIILSFLEIHGFFTSALSGDYQGRLEIASFPRNVCSGATKNSGGYCGSQTDPRGSFWGQNKPFLPNLVLVSALEGQQRPTRSQIYVEFFFTPLDRVPWGCTKKCMGCGAEQVRMGGVAKC